MDKIKHLIQRFSCHYSPFNELPWTKYFKTGHFSCKFINSRYLLDETIDDCNNNDEDVMSLEAADVLREWTEIWHQLYIDQDQSKFNQLKVSPYNFLF